MLSNQDIQALLNEEKALSAEMENMAIEMDRKIKKELKRLDLNIAAYTERIKEFEASSVELNGIDAKLKKVKEGYEEKIAEIRPLIKSKIFDELKEII